jgi:octanoyl-[GcvH]:protein N-octanoyltransferase
MNDSDIPWVSGMAILDRTTEAASPDVVRSFALDELLGKAAGNGGQPVCHLWRHPRAFVMGTRDSRLPHAAEAIRRLEEAGYSTLVRNSGGAAVPLDLGVVNLSLILPISEGKQDFRTDFERMHRLIRRTVAAGGREIDRGEVAGSYCPGDYDLQLDGLKFCGIAQRRQLRAMIIQAFIVVEGSGMERGELVRAFYERAASGAESDSFPAVRPEVMTSLAERSVKGLGTAKAFTEVIIRTLTEFGAIPQSEGSAGMRWPDETAIAEMSRQLRARHPVAPEGAR